MGDRRVFFGGARLHCFLAPEGRLFEIEKASPGSLRDFRHFPTRKQREIIRIFLFSTDKLRKETKNQ